MTENAKTYTYSYSSPASFWARLLAASIDFFLMILLTAWSLNFLSQSRTLPEAIIILLSYLALVLAPLWLINPILLVQLCNASLGKLITGLRLISEDGTKLTLKRNFFRNTLGYQFSWTLFGLGYLNVLTDKNRQAWHDKAVSSKVVYAQPFFWIIGLLAVAVLLIASFQLTREAIQNFNENPFLKLDIGRYIQASQMELIPPQEATSSTATSSAKPQIIYQMKPLNTPAK